MLKEKILNPEQLQQVAMSRNEERIATYFPNEERVVGSGAGSNNSAGKVKRQDRGTTTGGSTPASQASSNSPVADADTVQL